MPAASTTHMATETGLAVFGGVMLAHALGVASPGPDFAVVMRQALARGRGAGVWTAAGIGCGIVFHLAYGLFGLQWLMQQLPAAIHLIALAGAAFLIWMGAGALRAQPLPEQETPPASTARGGRADFLLGLATNVLNPKATLFFVALFSSIATGPLPATLQLAIAIWLPLATFAWFATLALLLSHAGLRRGLRRHAHRIDRAMGAILIALGVLVIARELG